MSSIIDAGFNVLRNTDDLRDRPAVLFHFTDMTSMLSIAQSRCIWASLATNLNDTTEIQYGLDLVRAFFRDGTLAVPQIFLDHVEYYLAPENSPQRAALTWRAYVSSFCARADRPLHWLRYGCRGTGVALGFDSSLMVRPGFNLIRVIYDPENQRRFVASLVSTIAEKFERACPGAVADETHRDFRSVAHLTAQLIWVASPRLKLPSLAGEEEWRLFTHELECEGIDLSRAHGNVPLPTLSRTSGTRQIPYKPCVYDQLPVRNIVFGTACTTTPEVLVLREMFPHARVSRSSVPAGP